MVRDLSKIDTTPGCADIFAPLVDPGDDAGYLTWAVAQLRSNPEFRQYIGLVTFLLHGHPRYSIPPTITGPYAGPLNRLVRSVDKRCRTQSGERRPEPETSASHAA